MNEYKGLFTGKSSIKLRQCTIMCVCTYMYVEYVYGHVYTCTCVDTSSV